MYILLLSALANVTQGQYAPLGGKNITHVESRDIELKFVNVRKWERNRVFFVIIEYTWLLIKYNDRNHG